MSSPITFSGFNNIDFGSIVTALMQRPAIQADGVLLWRLKG